MKPLRVMLLLAITAVSCHASEVSELTLGRGIWIQQPRKTGNAELAKLTELGVKRVHIMVTSSAAPLSDCKKEGNSLPTATAQKLIELVKASKDKGFKVIATAYVKPTKSDIQALTAADTGSLRALVDAGADGIEFDLEGPWSRAAVCGYGTHAEAAKALFDATRGLRPGLPVGVTTHLARAADPNLSLENADWVSLQAYEKCEVGNCVAFDDKREGPGARVARIPSALGSYGGPVIVGMAAFNQKWPSHTVADAMQRSLDAYGRLRERPTYQGYSYWSATWAINDPEVYRFLSSSAK
jgi:hypothetical protein